MDSGAAAINASHVDFIAVPVSDLAQADEFYEQKLGLARNPNSSGERWVEYETGNLTIGLSQFGGAVGLRVPDVEEARGELEEAGVEFHMDTFDSGVCNGAPFSDPDGNRLVLHRRYEPIESFDVPEGEIERTDFVGVNVTDREGASEFYGKTLGLKRNQLSSDEWPEFGADNVGFVLSTPEQKGGGDSTRSTGSRCAWPTWPSRWSACRSAASSSSSLTPTTRASATWRSSPIPTATG